MKKVLNLLLKQIHVILFLVVLLVLQAALELSLPQYTQNIVNVGIQQNGIEDSVYEAVSEKEMNELTIFMSQSEKKKTLKNYKLLDKDKLSKSEYKNYKEKYPKLKDINIYELKKIDKDDREKLDKTMAEPVMKRGVIASNAKQVKKLTESFGGVDNTFKAMSVMPKENLNSITKEFDKQIKKLEPTMITGMNVQTIKAEYKELGMDIDKIQTNYIFKSGLIMLGLALVSMVITIIVAYFSSKTGAIISRKLRSDVVHKVMDFGDKELKEFSTASLITRSTNDIQQVQMLIIMFFRMILFAPIIGIGAFLKVYDSGMNWVIAIAVGAILSLVIILFTIALPKFKSLQKLVDKLNLVSREILTGLPVIRAFSNEDKEEARFEEANQNLTKTNLFVSRIMSVMFPTMMFIMNSVSILVIWAAVPLIDAGSMQVGTLFAFISYTMQIIMSFLMFSMLSIILPRSVVSIKRIGEIFNKDISVKQNENPGKFSNKEKGSVEFKDVYFRYPDSEEDMIKNVSFNATKGTTTAIIGSTGSGKSTIVNLIPRFHDVTGGEIIIDGVNVKDADIFKLREKIGFIPQKGNLFSGTIKSNIAFGKDEMSDKSIEWAAEVSQAMEFINEKQDKFDTEISQGGTNVSGGQKQRLAIARALAKKPDILVFDDSFSALDYKTDTKLRKALKKELKDSTIFIVAQRISTIKNADQIIVLDDGEIVGVGTHKELLKDCNVYEEIATSQLSKEELGYE